MNKQRFTLSTSQIILLSFFSAILLGSFLLALPISSANGTAVPYIDALFTATTATCVTGLVTLPTVTAWSSFGHIVILILIQIGGLGIITIMSGLMIALHHKMSIGNRLLIQDAFNLNTMSGLASFVKKVIIGTLTIEGIGAALYMPVFVRDFGIKGIWFSVFNAISAFCNAGIDIFSENSLSDYVTNPLVNTVTSLLIIIGGIGYIVWWDLAHTVCHSSKKGLKKLKDLTLHSKIALTSTLLFIFVGATLIFIFEYNNPLTIKDLSFFDKIQVSLFQSVTTRTAGFFTVPQQNLTDGSAFISIILMFIGGSPVGTAGGIKTVTAVILFASAISTIKNKSNVNIFNRSVPKEALSKAVAVICTSFTIVFISTVLLFAVTGASALDVLYETVSAGATVGLTRNLTPSLNVWGKIIIIFTMYFGRVGPISLAIAFKIKKEQPEIIKNPTEKISVG